MTRAEVIAMRLAGGLAASTSPVVPLKTAPEPAPISPPAMRNKARLGADRRTETTSRVRPATMEAMPSPRAGTLAPVRLLDGGVRLHDRHGSGDAAEPSASPGLPEACRTAP